MRNIPNVTIFILLATCVGGCGSDGSGGGSGASGSSSGPGTGGSGLEGGSGPASGSSSGGTGGEPSASASVGGSGGAGGSGGCNAGEEEPCFDNANGDPIPFPGGTPQGSCQAGSRTCLDGVWSACIGAVAPQGKDTCAAGNDDDCSGTPNDGCDCVAGETASCADVFGSLGVCGAGTVTCDDSGEYPAACPVLPAAESCASELDEDCDGVVTPCPPKDIGEACAADVECASNFCVGWCTDYCSYDYQCPGDNWCIENSSGIQICFRGCDTSSDCSDISGASCQYVYTVSDYYTEVCAS